MTYTAEKRAHLSSLGLTPEQIDEMERSETEMERMSPEERQASVRREMARCFATLPRYKIGQRIQTCGPRLGCREGVVFALALTGEAPRIRFDDGTDAVVRVDEISSVIKDVHIPYTDEDRALLRSLPIQDEMIDAMEKAYLEAATT